MNSSLTVVVGRAKFMGTDAGRPIYPKFYFLVSFPKTELDSETFTFPQKVDVWTPLRTFYDQI